MILIIVIIRILNHCNYLIYTLHVFNNFIFNIWLFVSSKPWQDVGEPHVDFYCIHSASNITRFKCLLNENNEITFYVHWMSFISIFIFSSWTYVKHIVSMKTKRNINSTQYQLIQNKNWKLLYYSLFCMDYTITMIISEKIECYCKYI